MYEKTISGKIEEINNLFKAVLVKHVNTSVERATYRILLFDLWRDLHRLIDKKK